MSEQKQAPAQIGRIKQGKIPWDIHIAAYEVYCECYGEQEALIDTEKRGCRGGFGIDELIAFLYVRQFPRKEWRQRVDQALEGIESR
jgi:hypothetical protein